MKDAILKIEDFGTEYINRPSLHRTVSRAGAPGKAYYELRFVPAFDLTPNIIRDAGVTASTKESSMGGLASKDGSFVVFKPWVTGTFRHELGHCIYFALPGVQKTKVIQAYVDAKAKYQGYTPAVELLVIDGETTTLAGEDHLFAKTGLPSKRALDNVDEFFAETYRRYQIHAVRSAKGSKKPGLAAFRGASPMMADFMDRRYTAALV